MTKNSKWVTTDPETEQYGRKLSDKVFEFKEKRNGKVFNQIIDLEEYTEEQQQNCIVSYGYTLYKSTPYNTNIVELYGEDANWIIAECLFEMES